MVYERVTMLRYKYRAYLFVDRCGYVAQEVKKGKEKSFSTLPLRW